MNVFFNELSLPKFKDPQAAGAFFTTVSGLCVKVKELGIKEVKIPSSFHEHQFADGYFFASWLWDKHTDSDIKTLLLDMLTTTPSTDEILEQFGNDEGKLVEAQYEGKACVSLGLASDLIYNTAVISFPQEGQWDESAYPIVLRFLEEGKEGELITVETGGTARNISSAAHCTEHKDHFESLLRESAESGRELWEMREELFPHLEFCEKVKGQLQDFDSSIPAFVQITKRLFELENFARNWNCKPIKPADFAFKVTPESSTRRNRFEDDLTILCPDKAYRQFDWHARYTPGAGRIYFIPVEASGKLIVGSIGLKLI